MCHHESTVFRDKATDFVYCPVCQFPIGGDIAVSLGDTTLAKYIELARSRLVILFYAPWDGVSLELMPLFNECIRYCGDRAVLVSVDVSQNPESKRRFGINVLPTIIVIENTHEVNRIIGPIGRFDLDRLISNSGI